MTHLSHIAGAAPLQVPTPRQIGARRSVAFWLLGVAALVLLTVLVGGATRLTDSGLSITEWRPVTGVIPPFSPENWQEAFGKYQQIPEYRYLNAGMTLEAFKRIYWWEWGHRLLGRLIGLAFFLPLVYFLLSGRLERRLLPSLTILLVLGGLQGFMGWYMVMSGLTERVDVSQYRLVAHLGLAMVILSGIFWMALGLLRGTCAQHAARFFSDSRKRGAVLLAGVVFVQILLGGFVSGLDAGLIYNTWPLMEGAWIPEGLYPDRLAAFEDRKTAQFNHRFLAYTLVFVAVGQVWNCLRSGSTPAPSVQKSLGIVFVVLGVQVLLGILALVTVLHTGVALAHQGGAVLLLLACLYHLHHVTYSERA